MPVEAVLCGGVAAGVALTERPPVTHTFRSFAPPVRALLKRHQSGRDDQRARAVNLASVRLSTVLLLAACLVGTTPAAGQSRTTPSKTVSNPLPGDVPLTPPTIEANYAMPTIRWYGEAGITYELRRSPHPDQAAYPPILIYSKAQQTTGPVAAWQFHDLEPAPIDLHETTHFQLTQRDSRGATRTSPWVAYTPTPHGPVKRVEGGYWEVPQPNGMRLVFACVLVHHVEGSARSDVTVTRNGVVAGFWEGSTKYRSTNRMQLAALAQGELAGQIVARVDPDFPASSGPVRDPQHGLAIPLAAVAPMTDCPDNVGGLQ